MDRRDFLKCSSKACVGVGLGLMLNSVLLQSCGAGLSVIKASADAGWVRVSLHYFDRNTFMMLRVKDFPFDIAVQKQTSGQFLVLVLMCPHANQPVTKAGSGYLCTFHGSRFGQDGALLKGPSTQPLPELPFKHVGDALLIQTEKFKV